MNLNTLEYEDQVRAIAADLALRFVASQSSVDIDGVLEVADEFASYIANGMSVEQYGKLQGEPFNVYDRTVRERGEDDDG